MHGGVVVTGLGMATSLGFGMGVNWERMLGGESEIAENPAEDFLPPISLPVRLGAPVNREQLAEKIRRAVELSFNICNVIAPCFVIVFKNDAVPVLEPGHQLKAKLSSAFAVTGSDQAEAVQPVGIFFPFADEHRCLRIGK